MRRGAVYERDEGSTLVVTGDNTPISSHYNHLLLLWRTYSSSPTFVISELPPFTNKHLSSSSSSSLFSFLV